MRFAHTKGADIKSLHGAFSLPLHTTKRCWGVCVCGGGGRGGLAALHTLTFTVVWHLKAAVRFLQEIIDLSFLLQKRKKITE